MADPQLGKPAQVSEEDTAAYLRQQRIKSGAAELINPAALGIAGFPTAARVTAGALPAAQRTGAKVLAYIVQHPQTKEITKFGLESGQAALAFAERLGVKVRTVFVPGK